PKLDATSWFAVFAPARTPQQVIDRLSSEIATVMTTPAFKQKAAEQGAAAEYMNPKQLSDYSTAELARWAQVVKSSKIDPPAASARSRLAAIPPGPCGKDHALHRREQLLDFAEIARVLRHRCAREQHHAQHARHIVHGR